MQAPIKLSLKFLLILSFNQLFLIKSVLIFQFLVHFKPSKIYEASNTKKDSFKLAFEQSNQEAAWLYTDS